MESNDGIVIKRHETTDSVGRAPVSMQRETLLDARVRPAFAEWSSNEEVKYKESLHKGLRTMDEGTLMLSRNTP